MIDIDWELIAIFVICVVAFIAAMWLISVGIQCAPYWMDRVALNEVPALCGLKP